MFAKHLYITGQYTVFLFNILAFLLFRSLLILVSYINIVFPSDFMKEFSDWNYVCINAY
jgi:hypothetical protein